MLNQVAERTLNSVQSKENNKICTLKSTHEF